MNSLLLLRRKKVIRHTVGLPVYQELPCSKSMRRILFEERFSEYRDGHGAWYVLWHESKGNEPGIQGLVMQASPLCFSATHLVRNVNCFLH